MWIMTHVINYDLLIARKLMCTGITVQVELVSEGNAVWFSRLSGVGSCKIERHVRQIWKVLSFQRERQIEACQLEKLQISGTEIS